MRLVSALFTRLFLVLEGVGIAIDAIKANKVRAALTILGVAVGVFVVTAMAAAVHGVRESFKSDVDAFGATTFQVRRRPINIGGCSGSDDECPERRNPGLTLTEAATIRALPSVKAVVELWSSATSMKYRDRVLGSTGYDALGTDWLETDRGDISPGRNFTAQEFEAAARVAILNDSAVAQLFGDSDPIGKEILLGGQQFTVIGVYHTEAGFLKTMNGRGPDKPRAIVPFSTARRHLGLPTTGAVFMVKPRDGTVQADVMDQVTATLRSMRGLRPNQPNNFALETQDKLLDVFDQLFGAIFLVGIALSGVGLMVGGVGVVAIMMISVTERTREIGVRKALGATRATILWQFLVEAATLTSLGALIGLAGGTVLAWVVRSFTPVPTAVPPSAVVTALLAAAVTGVVFGMLPATRASRLDPVEALRYE
jgi:putative ABC transport system permease protein